ncbi:MAG: hypothetical protein JNM91_09030 [Flavobacteriales bacterium]|nr:hypothetical protein [Flavobacteriales bacterium]
MNHTPLAIIASIIVCMTSCGQGGPEQAAVVPKKTAPLKEHVVSPLAQLMRDMTAFADSTRSRLMRGEDLLPYPAHFKDMVTLESTPGMVDHRTYDPFAFSYLHQLDSLYKVVPAQRGRAFDELVQYCSACHGQVCPGPLVRINKLRMPA